MAFEIAELEAGDGWLGICPLPGRFNPYARDLASILAWRPNAVMTLTTLPEMARHGAETLGADLRAQGVAWHHLPVPDFGVPPVDLRAVISAPRSPTRRIGNGRPVRSTNRNS